MFIVPLLEPILNPKLFPRACALIPVIALTAVTLSACSFSRNDSLEVTGQIEGNPIRAGSRVGGRVIEVLVNEGDAVAKDQVLVRLEPNEAQARYDAAAARVVQAQAMYDKIRKGAREEEIRQAAARVNEAEQHYNMALEGARSQEIAKARANLETAKANLDETMLIHERAVRLRNEGAVAQSELDAAFNAKEAAKGQYDAAREQLGLLVEGTRDEEIRMAQSALELAQAQYDELKNGAREEDVESTRAAVELAKADLALAEVSLDEMTIRAPMNGVIESLDVHPGDLVGPQPILELLDPDDLEVTIYVSAALLGKLRIGETVSLSTDSHGEERFEGQIIHIANSGEFTPRNLQTQQERVQQVFGVRLKLDSHEGKLRPGMTVTARLHAEAEPA